MNEKVKIVYLWMKILMKKRGKNIFLNENSNKDAMENIFMNENMN